VAIPLLICEIQKKILSNLKFTRKGLNFEYKTIPIGYLAQKLEMFRHLHNFEFFSFINESKESENISKSDEK
jgi:hypothetical protein